MLEEPLTFLFQSILRSEESNTAINRTPVATSVVQEYDGMYAKGHAGSISLRKRSGIKNPFPKDRTRRPSFQRTTHARYFADFPFRGRVGTGGRQQFMSRSTSHHLQLFSPCGNSSFR